jgi:bifunctional DNase/RNase
MTNTPVLILREVDLPRRQIDIFIGAPEAAAIKMALDDEQVPRPLTHDLFILSLEKLGSSVVRVVLTHVASGTYFADIVLVNEAGDEVVVSARPSDAVAIALRAMCPIYAAETLLEQVGEVVDEEDVTTQSEIIDEFRDFIENISPEDFSS